ncbi:MAG: LysR family transcriptional regulator, low CO2-responsive transcriptional regulator [Solirubrobacteraceae bacterium]|nr:LysR family transcriptional regulator, low CO2-responsive transcriptional regulator [Solirubrobacteraceae bacterium]
MDLLRDEPRLRAFLAVSDAGSFSAAARATGQTQPAVSTLVRALEDRLGTPLFVRGRAGARLTPAGTALRPHAAHLLGAAEEARGAVDAAAAPGRRRLRIGGGEVLMTYVLPPALARVRERLPGLEASFTVGDETTVLAALREHRIDVALVTDRAPADGLAVEAFAEDRLVLLGASSLAEVDTLVVRAAGAVDRRAAEALLERAGVEPPRRLTAATFEAVKACVAAGLGAALVPACAAGEMAAIDVGAEPLKYCAAWRAGEEPAIGAALLDALRRPG